jgi:hypothetical protein
MASLEGVGRKACGDRVAGAMTSDRTRAIVERQRVSRASPPTIFLARDEVPAIPLDAEEWTDGICTIYEHGDRRWEVRAADLAAYMVYRPKADRERGVFPWSHMHVDAAASER